MNEGTTGTVIEDFIRDVRKGQENVLDLVRQVGQDGTEHIVVGLQNRELQPEQPKAPIREETPARCHQFHDIDAMTSYLEQYGTEHTVVLADVKAGAFSAVIDESQENGIEVIGCKPLIHPLFEPWDGMFDSTVPVLEFAKFIMQHRRAVTHPDGRELALMFSQITAKSNVTLNRGSGSKSINGVMVEVKIEGSSTTRTEPHELPDSITIEVPIYVNQIAQRIELDLMVSMDGNNEVVVYVSASGLLEAKVRSMLDMLTTLRSALDVGTIGLGTVKHIEWDYLE